jgi:hydroxymethylpyrimidine pyrophosphatase-like HAD family hydrolase
MGNGHPALLAKADFVSTSNDQDGILAGVQWALSQP